MRTSIVSRRNLLVSFPCRDFRFYEKRSVGLDFYETWAQRIITGAPSHHKKWLQEKETWRQQRKMDDLLKNADDLLKNAAQKDDDREKYSHVYVYHRGLIFAAFTTGMCLIYVHNFLQHV